MSAIPLKWGKNEAKVVSFLPRTVSAVPIQVTRRSIAQLCSLFSKEGVHGLAVRFRGTAIKGLLCRRPGEHSYRVASGHERSNVRHNDVSPKPSWFHQRSSICVLSASTPSRVTPRGG